MKTVLVGTSILVVTLISVAQIGIMAPEARFEIDVRPSGREGHCLVYDAANRRVILLDGYQPPHKPEFGEVWSWDGKHWEIIPGHGPTARSLSGAVYDSRRKRIVLFGGVGNKGYEDLRGDTWEWDGKRWWEMSDRAIGTRDHHAMVYDEARAKTVMYGGVNAAREFVKDTCEWDGTKWTRIAAPGPGGRVHFAMTYDSSRKKVVLFGGSGEDRRKLNDTWEWDGANWTQVSNQGPSPRSHHRMAYDKRNGVSILYGGAAASTQPGIEVLDDMWAWDGKRWTEIKTKGPGKRFLQAMTYDVSRGRLVLYGGGDGRNLLDDTWEWDGKQWIFVK
jgi:hypothetical protein